MQSASDAELVHAIAEREAADELCRRYAPRIRLYGIKHLRNDDDAAELVQVVLLAVLEAARNGRIDDPQRLDRFVLGTCRNTTLRMRQRRARTPIATERAVLDLPALSTPTRVELRPLFGCLGELEERARNVLMMSFAEGCEVDEIATRLALSAGNVRVVRHRALASLRRCLDAKETP